MLVLLLISIRPPLWKSPSLLLASVLMTTLLASPYLYNYDFLLLLVPFALLADSTIGRIAVIIFCVSSTFALGKNYGIWLAALAARPLISGRCHALLAQIVDEQHPVPGELVGVIPHAGHDRPFVQS